MNRTGHQDQCKYFCMIKVPQMVGNLYFGLQYSCKMTAVPHLSSESLSKYFASSFSFILACGSYRCACIYFLLWSLLQTLFPLATFSRLWLECVCSHFGLVMDTPGPLYIRQPTDRRKECSTFIGKDDNGGIMTLKCSPWSGQGPSLISRQLADIGCRHKTAVYYTHLKGEAPFARKIHMEHLKTTELFNSSYFE